MRHLSATELLAYLRRLALHLAVAPDGALHVRPASALDAELRAAIAHHKHELLALLAPNGADVLADDRRCCRDCYHLQTKGNCAMAAQGRLPGVPRWYTPAKDLPARCHLFCALPY
ncbi:hypothetical protein [Diaphorobacter sp.]|uniref:TubC N-terminal docking domain-related protein n=1 Tax=Diaphorobacter sp. TaxID=1934310 RepID=UPI003D1412A9